MSLLPLDTNLTQDGNLETFRLARQTHAGMAHFAGTGPAGRTCRECQFWQHQGTWHSAGGKHGGVPHAARCLRYRQLTSTFGEKVPHNALACKHFDPAKNPQPLQRPKRAGE